jgi:hypothetical protein
MVKYTNIIQNTHVQSCTVTEVMTREGAPQRQDNKFQTKTLEKEAISVQTSTKCARHQDILTLTLTSRQREILRIPRCLDNFSNPRPSVL